MGIEDFDFSGPAELFVASNRFGRRPSMSYRRFDTAALAIRYSVEQQPGSSLRGTTLESNGSRFLHREILALYDSSAYPLERSGARALS